MQVDTGEACDGTGREEKRREDTRIELFTTHLQLAGLNFILGAEFAAELQPVVANDTKLELHKCVENNYIRHIAVQFN